LAHQRGVILIISLIVLVAMSLAAVALTRSVDVANIAAGNLSFKKSALSATDRGVETAIAKFRAAGALLTNNESNLAAENYFAQIQPSDARGVPNQLLAAIDPATCQTNPPGTFWLPTTQECVRYLIERQCTQAGAWDEPHCAVIERAGAAGGTAGQRQTGASSIALYRVTVRVDGPRNTAAFSQVIFRP
jgi:Tfp pilus assembly protein PilX